jgi:hypothetical protein
MGGQRSSLKLHILLPLYFSTVPFGNQVTIPCSITSAAPSATNVYWTRNQNNNIININNGDSGYQGICLLVLKRIMKLNRIIPDWTERKSIWILGLPYNITDIFI